MKGQLGKKSLREQERGKNRGEGSQGEGVNWCSAPETVKTRKRTQGRPRDLVTCRPSGPAKQHVKSRDSRLQKECRLESPGAGSSSGGEGRVHFRMSRRVVEGQVCVPCRLQFPSSPASHITYVSWVKMIQPWCSSRLQ